MSLACKSSANLVTQSAILWLVALFAALCPQTFASYPHPHHGPFPGAQCSSNADCFFNFGGKSARQMVCGSKGVCECPSTTTQIHRFNYYTGFCDTEKGLQSKSSCLGSCELDGNNARSTCTPGAYTDASGGVVSRCLCNPGFTLNTVHNVCVRKYGEYCTQYFRPGEEHHECWVKDEFFTCGRKSSGDQFRCGCFDPYTYDPTSHSCVFIMNKPCSASGKAWEPRCQGGFYSKCDGKCQCKAGFTYNPTSKTCSKTKDQSCAAGTSGEPDECDAKAHLKCRDSKCQCKDGFEPDEKAGGVCKLKSKGACTSSMDCKQDFFCSADHKCVCPAPNVEVSGDCGCPKGQEIWKHPGLEAKCRIKASGSCKDETSCGPNSHCSGGHCVCLSGATPIDGFCYFPINATVPDAVPSTSACSPSLEYTSGSCVCNGAYDKFLLKCFPPNTVVSNCAVDSDCEPLVANCAPFEKDFKRCVCKEGYKTTKEEKCVGGAYSRPCASDSHCDASGGLRCVSGICQCKNKNYALIRNKCAVRAGQVCNRKVDICEPDFTCSTDGRCVCSTESGGNVVCFRSEAESEEGGEGKIVIDVNAYSSFVVYTFIVLAGIVLAAVVISVIILKGSIERSQRNWALAVVENIKVMINDRNNNNAGNTVVVSTKSGSSKSKA